MTMKQWLEQKNDFYTRLLNEQGETVTNKQAIKANVYALLFMLAIELVSSL